MNALIEFNVGAKKLHSFYHHDGVKEMFVALYRVLAAAELAAPPSTRGSFIPARSSFDAFAAITKVFRTATKDILIIDPYMDETVLTDFSGAVPDGVALRLLSDQSAVKPSLKPAAERWKAQYAARKLLVRLAPAKTLHDRAIFVDSREAWILTQSLKDFAKRSPAEIVRADDTAALKVDAYEAIWNAASVVV